MYWFLLVGARTAAALWIPISSSAATISSLAVGDEDDLPLEDRISLVLDARLLSLDALELGVVLPFASSLDSVLLGARLTSA